ncbi:MAG TPA: aspartate aminotransferase family protein, partial [Solirubrobacterales bacterium]|nr:aspartate aminotransferase family protein [Solirubrobacterales bacterium]HNF84880.1 aspartate aminotransferase family protein [Solirubrobacterales bacterium]
MTGESSALQSAAKQHLMLHFSDMKSLSEEGMTIIERGEGVHVFDDQGGRYIDGLSGLYCASLGHSHGDEIGAAAHEQMKKLPYAT